MIPLWPEALVALAARYNIPAIYYSREFVVAGAWRVMGPAIFTHIVKLASIAVGSLLGQSPPICR
jgi:hypothetical protein